MSPPPPFEQISGPQKRLTDKNYFGWERLCGCRAFLFLLSTPVCAGDWPGPQAKPPSGRFQRASPAGPGEAGAACGPLFHQQCPASSPFASPPPLPQGGFLERKPTSIADKIAKTKPPHLSQGYQPPLRIIFIFSAYLLFGRSAPPTPSLPRGGHSLGGQLPHLCTTLRGEIYHNFQ